MPGGQTEKPPPAGRLPRQELAWSEALSGKPPSALLCAPEHVHRPGRILPQVAHQRLDVDEFVGVCGHEAVLEIRLSNGKDVPLADIRRNKPGNRANAIPLQHFVPRPVGDVLRELRHPFIPMLALNEEGPAGRRLEDDDVHLAARGRKGRAPHAHFLPAHGGRRCQRELCGEDLKPPAALPHGPDKVQVQRLLQYAVKNFNSYKASQHGLLALRIDCRRLFIHEGGLSLSKSRLRKNPRLLIPSRRNKGRILEGKCRTAPACLRGVIPSETAVVRRRSSPKSMTLLEKNAGALLLLPIFCLSGLRQTPESYRYAYHYGEIVARHCDERRNHASKSHLQRKTAPLPKGGTPWK